MRSYGATEVFPPEDADLIVDNTATGSTLRANGLAILDTLMRSSTRLYASRPALDDPARRGPIEDLVLLLKSVLEARRRVMLELNVAEADFERVVSILPCMREPTVSRLHGEAGYAVRAAVPRTALPALLLEHQGAGRHRSRRLRTAADRAMSDIIDLSMNEGEPPSRACLEVLERHGPALLRKYADSGAPRSGLRGLPRHRARQRPRHDRR